MNRYVAYVILQTFQGLAHLKKEVLKFFIISVCISITLTLLF